MFSTVPPLLAAITLLAQATPLLPPPPLPRATTAAQPDEIGRVRARRAYCDPVITNANATIGKIQANDATLATIMNRLSTADFDRVTIFARTRTVNQLEAYGASLQRASADAQINLRKIRDAANTVEDVQRRHEIEDMAKALDASLDRQRKIGIDLVKSMIIYEGRLATINVNANNGKNDTTNENFDGSSITKLAEIFPASMERDKLKQTATFDETAHQIGDEFADRITVINAFEGIASQYSARATTSCLDGAPAPSPAPAKKP